MDAPVARAVAALAGAVVAGGLLAGCAGAAGPGADPPAGGSVGSGGSAGPGGETDGVVVVATGLASPWALDFLPDGAALVTVRDTGEVVRVERAAAASVVGIVDGVRHGGEGGLLGIAVSPQFESDGAVFVYATTDRDNRVLRLRLAQGRLEPDGVVLAGIPRAGNHNGGRIAFGPDGHLYVATGDAGSPRSSQDPDSLAGKILRIAADGSVPPDNPVAGSPVWSWGHRNVQGLAWDDDGRMFASEFGQNTWDELNVITPGANYGWPIVEGTVGDARSRDGEPLVDPVVQWRPSEASPSGIAVLGDAVYVAALRGQSLWRVPLLPDGSAASAERLLEGDFGRLRAVEVGPAGDLWLLTSNTTRGRPAPDDDRVVVVRAGAL